MGRVAAGSAALIAIGAALAADWTSDLRGSVLAGSVSVLLLVAYHRPSRR